MAKGRIPCGENRTGAKITEKEARHIYSQVQRGALQRDIAKAHQVSPATVNDLIRGRHWKHLQLHPLTSSIRLTFAMAEEIRAEHRSGMSAAALARKYKYDHGSMSRLLRGLIWPIPAERAAVQAMLATC